MSSFWIGFWVSWALSIAGWGILAALRASVRRARRVERRRAARPRRPGFHPDGPDEGGNGQ